MDYDLSSWKHLEDDIVPEEFVKHTHPVLTKLPVYDRIVKTGYVCKGGGSAYGGEWQPKDENSKRYLGKPNTTKRSTIKTKKGEYEVDTSYGNDGRATRERHYTDHGKPAHHSTPHDHEIGWDNNHPNPKPPINYWDGVFPKFKNYIESEKMNMTNSEKYVTSDYNPDEHKFETLGEFKFYLSCGANVGFEYNGVEYGIEGHNNSFDIWIYDGDVLANNITLEDVMNYELDGVKIRDLILKAEITERIM